MQISKKTKRYILQYQLIALDEDKHESGGSLEPVIPVIVKSKEEAQPYLTQGKTVILDGLTMSTVKGSTHVGKLETMNQSLSLGSGDVKRIHDAMRIVQQYIDHGSLERMMQVLQKDFEKNFNDLKEAIKPHSNADDTQYLIAKSLNEIEARTSDYPLITAKQAAALYGEVSAVNSSRLITKLKKELKIIGFYFGNSRSIQIPAFQFDMVSLGVHKPVERLCHILDGLNDWGVYKWLTTHNDDLGCTPAQAINRPELAEDLLYLASIFKSESTLRDLTFVSKTNNN